MNRITSIVLIASLAFIGGISAFAETIIPLKTGEPKPPINPNPTTPTKPKAPALKSISCSIDNGTVTIKSKFEQMAEVLIYNNDSGFILHHSFNNSIYPEMNIPMNGQSGRFTIIIATEDATYQGVFEII